MLPADRDLSEGSDDSTAKHPAVLRAIKQVEEASESRQCPVCVCGEEAGDAYFACLLAGLGVRELSLSPTRAAAVSHALRHIDCHYAMEVAGVALHCRTARQERDLLLRLVAIEVGCNSS